MRMLGMLSACLLAMACAPSSLPDAALDDSAASTALAVAPPPLTPNLQVTALLPGQPIEFLVTGLPPATNVLVFATPRGLGSGPCGPGGTVCLGLRTPVFELVRGRTDANGGFRANYTIPAALPYPEVWFQAAAVKAPDLGVSPIVSRVANDADLDRYPAGVDCDDADPALNLDDADQDGSSTCTGDCDDSDPALDGADADSDGYSTCAGDCDDQDPLLNPADPDGDGFSTCNPNECLPDVIFAVGVFGTTTCAQRCASQGQQCVGIGTDSGAANDLYFECFGATSGVATQTAPGTCATVLGGQGCSEYTSCQCAPLATEEVVFAVGVFGTTTCAQRCVSEGGTCTGIGTDAGADNGLYFECFGATSGVATQTNPGSCSTVLGGQGCSEYTNCACDIPDPTCTDGYFAVGVFGTTSCEQRCASEGLSCVGLGTDPEGLDGLYYECFGATSGVATQTAPGTCATVLGGQGCSEYTTCRCFDDLGPP